MIGYNPKDIPYTFSPVPPELTECPDRTVPNPEARVMADPAGEQWVKTNLYRFRWDDHWVDIPLGILQRVFSFEERARFWVGSCMQSEVSEHMDPLLWKLHNTHWRYGMYREWNLLVQHMDGLKRLDFGLPDFDVRLVHTVKYNTCGYSEQVRSLYLDAALGLLVYYKHEHVLTVGFAPTKDGILIAQIQLRHKKGNRFLYRLPTHHVDYVLDVFQRAFPTDKLLMVDGHSAVEAIRDAYGKTLPADFTPDVSERIQATYDRPLTSFRRAKKVVLSHGRKYFPLRPVQRAA